jgi:hypothetical protein
MSNYIDEALDAAAKLLPKECVRILLIVIPDEKGEGVKVAGSSNATPDTVSAVLKMIVSSGSLDKSKLKTKIATKRNAKNKKK